MDGLVETIVGGYLHVAQEIPDIQLFHRAVEETLPDAPPCITNLLHLKEGHLAEWQEFVEGIETTGIFQLFEKKGILETDELYCWGLHQLYGTAALRISEVEDYLKCVQERIVHLRRTGPRDPYASTSGKPHTP